MSERSAWLLKMAGGSEKKAACAEVRCGGEVAKNFRQKFFDR